MSPRKQYVSKVIQILPAEEAGHGQGHTEVNSIRSDQYSIDNQRENKWGKMSLTSTEYIFNYSYISCYGMTISYFRSRSG